MKIVTLSAKYNNWKIMLELKSRDVSKNEPAIILKLHKINRKTIENRNFTEKINWKSIFGRKQQLQNYIRVQEPIRFEKWTTNHSQATQNEKKNWKSKSMSARKQQLNNYIRVKESRRFETWATGHPQATQNEQKSNWKS